MIFAKELKELSETNADGLSIKPGDICKGLHSDSNQN